MQDKNKDLSQYRLSNANETFDVANDCFTNGHYRDAINRSYYAAFYAAKAVLALDEIDFKRHKDVIAYFNKEFVATEKISREIGKKLARLQQKREKSDYDDFFIASQDEAASQIEAAKDIINAITEYLK